jgi:glyoxalase family protein
MPASVLGLHHVTATVDGAQEDLDFSVGILGQRLVKKTVNFDNHGVYHFYYGNEHGTPGTIWTTFPYRGKGVPPGTKGYGQITTTAFSVPAGSLASWTDRLAARGVRTYSNEARFGDDVLTFEDPSGLVFEMVANGEDKRPPWTGGQTNAGNAIRGLHSVTLTIQSPPETLAFLKTFLGLEPAERDADRIRLAVNGGGPGRTIDIVHPPGGPGARNGLGTVHHVALAVPSPDEQLAIRSALAGAGWKVTPVMDRQYFQSIYFREPGGVLFEVATVPPGFEIDEPAAHLGEGLKLPPWEEPNRAAIEAALPPVAVPAPSGPGPARQG